MRIRDVSTTTDGPTGHTVRRLQVDIPLDRPTMRRVDDGAYQLVIAGLPVPTESANAVLADIRARVALGSSTPVTAEHMRTIRLDDALLDAAMAVEVDP
jgi:hypothetical protein